MVSRRTSSRRPRRIALSTSKRAKVVSNLKRGGTSKGKRFVPLSSKKTQRTIRTSRGFSRPKAIQRVGDKRKGIQKQTFRSVTGGKGTSGFISGSGRSRSFGGVSKVHRLTKDTRTSATRPIGRFTGMLNVAGKSVRERRTFKNIGQKGFQKSTQPLRSVTRKVAAQKTKKPLARGNSIESFEGFSGGSAINNVFGLIEETSIRNAERKEQLGDGIGSMFFDNFF